MGALASLPAFKFDGAGARRGHLTLPAASVFQIQYGFPKGDILMPPNFQVLEVWGDFACFSRPELKVERFSYPVITPSAARGIFDAIYAKPVEFRWAVTAVEMLSRALTSPCGATR